MSTASLKTETGIGQSNAMASPSPKGSAQGISTVTEGKAEVYLPKSVFYNPVQEFNRDLTIAVVSEFTREFIDEPRHKKQVAAANALAAMNRPNSNDCANDGKIVQNDLCSKDESMSTEQEKTTSTSTEQEKTTSTSTEQEKTTSTTNNNNNNSDNMEKSIQDAEPLEAGKYYENGVRILEGLAASGLRSIRFGLEIPGVKEIIANDFDKNAVEYIKKNIEKNKLEGIVRANYGDASMVMYANREYEQRFDVIDLDPYGSPARFLDGAVQAVTDGGLLCVTCTDTAVLCGNAGETCFSKYRAMSLRSDYCHEMGLRIILQAIETHANCYSRYIEPLVSISADFYVRVFVRVFKGQGKVKQSVSKLAMVYHCVGCGTFNLQRMGEKTPTKGDNFKYTPAQGPPVGKSCAHCGARHNIGGPIWAEPLHNKDFVKKVIASVEKDSYQTNTKDRILGMLSVVHEELPDAPLYYIGDGICDKLHCIAPSLLQFRSALLNSGYQVSMSHCTKNSHKTNAPAEFIWDIMRAWIKDHPVKEKRLQPGSVAKAILEKETTNVISFVIHPDANPPSRKQGLLRWQVNPEPYWGPRPRAKIIDESQRQTQNETRSRPKKRKQEKVERDLKKYPCKHIKTGNCQLGDSCCYSHDLTSSSVEAEDSDNSK